MLQMKKCKVAPYIVRRSINDTRIPPGLTLRQQQVWVMRRRRNWPLSRIAYELGISESAVSRLLERAAASTPPDGGGHAFKRRRIRPASLNRLFDI